MFTYVVTDNPPMCDILADGVVIDHSGPWESVESADMWASAYTNKLNAGLVVPEQPS